MTDTSAGVRLRYGTSGFAYREWKGSFYPDDLPAARMLSFYADRFPAVEINNTFYRMPRESVLSAWARQVPPDFRFVLKATQWITHRKRLRDAAEPLRYFLDSAAALGEARGPVLFQLPPNMKKDLDRLRGFLELLPPDGRAAFEFRHASWLDPHVFDALRDHGAAFCIADDGDDPVPRLATAGWGYLRLRREAYDDTSLAEWAAWIHGREWSDVYVFFKHEDGATGPALATRFASVFRNPAS